MALRLHRSMRTSLDDFPGASAPWADHDDTVYPMRLRSAAEALADRLDARAAHLRSDDVTTDDVLMEIRRQIASCALDDVIRASDLAELMLDLVWSQEHAARAV